MRASWTEKKGNKEIVRTTTYKRKVSIKIRTRHAKFITRKKKLEHVRTSGNIEGKISVGRHRIKRIDSLPRWYGMIAAEQMTARFGGL